MFILCLFFAMFQKRRIKIFYYKTLMIKKSHGPRNKLEECPKHYEDFDAHAPRKTKVLPVIINPMLIRIFVKPLNLKQSK